MSKEGTMKKGVQWTSIGWIPNDWCLKTFEEILLIDREV
jgi:hypothetical protein